MKMNGDALNCVTVYLLPTMKKDLTITNFQILISPVNYLGLPLPNNSWRFSIVVVSFVA